MLTSFGESQDRFWGIESGADCYIVKGKEEAELLSQIKYLLTSPTTVNVKQINPSKKTGRHSIRSNYILDKLVMESTISLRANDIAKNAENSQQLMGNFFDLLYKLADYSLAQFLIRAKQHYYCNVDVREKEGLLQDVVFAEDRVSPQIKLGVPQQNQKTLIFHKENLISETNQIPSKSQLQSHIVFPFLVEEDIIAILAVHHTEANKYSSNTEDFLRCISQHLTPVIKCFLLLEQSILSRQWYENQLTQKINSRLKKIAGDSRRLSDELAGEIEEKSWNNLRQLTAIAEESQQIIMDTVMVPQKLIHKK